MTRSENGAAFGQVLGWALFIAGIFFLNFLSRVTFGPLMPVIREELGISHAQAGSIFLMVAVGNALGLLLSGFVSRRLGHRRTVGVSGLIVGLMCLSIGFCDGLSTLRAFTGLLGLAAGIYLPSGLTSITTLIRRADWGKALTVHELAPNTAFVVAPLLAEAALLQGDWRDAFRLLGALQLLAGCAFLWRGRGADFPGIVPSPGAMLAVLRRPVFWLFALLFSLAVGASVGPYSMLPLYLVDDHGYARPDANGLLAAARVAGIFLPFFAGWLADRMGGRAALVLYLALTGSATVGLGLASGPWLPTMVLLQPALSVLFYPPAFSLLSAAFDDSERSLAVSLLTPISATVGLGLTPTLLGWLGDHGLFGLGFTGQGVLLLAALLLFPTMPRR
jgi:NNP family nitrate/nitrite transporter-like MFS transporter